MVVTPDKDMCQLIDDSIGILRPLRGQEAIGTPFDYVDSSGVLSRFGVAPALIPDWLALIGDVSDNIPGVDGVGPKTATKLLQEYGDLRTLMTHSKGIKGKVGEALREASSFYEVSLKLTTIQTTLASDGWVVIPGAASIDKIESIAATYQMPSWMGRFLFLSDLFPAEGA